MGIFLCDHLNQTTPRRDEAGEYRRCLDCGERLAWSWPDDFPIHPPKLIQPRVAPSVGPSLVQRPAAIWERKKSA